MSNPSSDTLDSMPPINNGRLSLLPPYLASEINAQNAALRAKGVDVIDLGMGNPVDPVDPQVVAALKTALDNPSSHRYAPATGIASLKAAFVRHYQRQYDVELVQDKEVIVGLGSKDTFSHLFLAILGTGDSCVVPTPAYPPHIYAPMIAGARVIGVPMTEEQPGVKLLADIQHVFETTTPKPKLLILNFPHNPTAKTVDLPFYEQIVAMAKKYRFWVLNDLAYGHTCFDGYKAPSILQVKGVKEVAVETFTMSKPYSLAGWRVGFMAGNASLIDALARIKPYFDYGHFSAIQEACAVALDTGDAFITKQAMVYQQRLDVLLAGLEKNGWGRTIKNRGTMFSWQIVPQKFQEIGSIEFCKQLAEKAGVSFFPGAGYGPEGEGFVRVALVEPNARIEEACRRIGEFLRSANT